MPNGSRQPLLYVLHSSKLHGTERIALDTAMGLADEFEPIIFGPPGPAMDEAERLGFEARRFNGFKEFAKSLRPCLARFDSLTFVATGVTQSAACIALNVIYRRKIRHFHIVHGGASDRQSYGRKKWLNHAGVTFITVSDWTKQKLIAHGVRAELIEVVPNSLPVGRVAAFPKRPPYNRPGVRKVIVVARLDPLKRVALLFDALDLGSPELAQISFTIIGLGEEYEPLRKRAAERHPNVQLVGASDAVPQAMAASDLLVHTCPIETFGLVVLEAMAANIAVLVPDSAGTGLVVQEGINGFKYRPDDPAHLAERLAELHKAPADLLNRITAAGRVTVEETYSSKKMLDRYRSLFSGR
jgi:glycosyltransferase involved in cell wall biosynthesis